MLKQSSRDDVNFVICLVQLYAFGYHWLILPSLPFVSIVEGTHSREYAVAVTEDGFHRKRGPAAEPLFV